MSDRMSDAGFLLATVLATAVRTLPFWAVLEAGSLAEVLAAVGLGGFLFYVLTPVEPVFDECHLHVAWVVSVLAFEALSLATGLLGLREGDMLLFAKGFGLAGLLGPWAGVALLDTVYMVRDGWCMGEEELEC